MTSREAKWLQDAQANAPGDPMQASIYWSELSAHYAREAVKYARVAAWLWVAFIVLVTTWLVLVLR